MLCVQTKSLFTGELNNMDIPATYEQLEFLTRGMTRAERRQRFGPLAV